MSLDWSRIPDLEERYVNLPMPKEIDEDVKLAIQAAYMSGEPEFADALATEHGLIDLCLRCVSETWNLKRKEACREPGKYYQLRLCASCVKRQEYTRNPLF